MAEAGEEELGLDEARETLYTLARSSERYALNLRGVVEALNA